MIYLNGKPFEIDHFSDGSLMIKEDVPRIYGENRKATLKWIFENDTETVALYYLTRHLREHGTDDINLVMPYIPNARQDRVTLDRDIFTLKYFAEIINSLKFTSVTVLDPHSTVSEALIDRIVVRSAKENINEVIKRIGDEDIMLFFPDEGAMKRYSSMADKPFIYGMKKRDKMTRAICEMHILGAKDLIPGKNILMADDICSSGKTLLGAAHMLKQLGAGRIFLYVSHCEDQILDSELLLTDLVERIYTTDSFLKVRHEKIEILPF